MTELDIKHRCQRRASFSTWRSDPPWLESGETATVFGWDTAGENPLYKVRRDRDGEVKAIYRDQLVKHGDFE